MSKITKCACGSTRFNYTQVLSSTACFDAANPHTLIVSRLSCDEEIIECGVCSKEFADEGDTLQITRL